jgi:hypothetical protein
MTRLVFHADRAAIPAAPVNGEVQVWLYGPSAPYAHVGTVGAQALDAAARFGVRPSAAVMDFLSIAMAVTAADTFVKREDAPDGWSRSFEIVLPLAAPARWQPLRVQLEATLRFLSGDRWTFDLRPGGVGAPPLSEIRRKLDVIDLSKSDCVALFSGGLDSAIGTLDLIAQSRRPLLVSHASRGDAHRQVVVANRLPATCQRVAVNTYPTLAGVDDDSMRSRSIQFLALAALAAQAMASFRSMQVVDLYVYENGLIALNPPLTPRRIGSHSTRTAHPFFLDGIRDLFAATGIPARIINPYEYRTKGEIVAAHAATASFGSFAVETVSCGKWKRKNQQCGRCVPCLIRRASLHTAGVADVTSYQSPDLRVVMSEEGVRDDLVAVQSAILRLPKHRIEPWVLQAGPLPQASQARQAYFDVAARGMAELASYLRAEGFVL